ncbi:MAG: T9SS type A sorting domain-containing protein, partial [Bacteroidota bacterium]
ETKNGVYNHTKTICDRLNDSKLRDVRTVRLQGHELVYSKLERNGGAVEYALVFSVKEEGSQRTLYSLWNIGEYPSGDYMNFQVWGNSMGQVSTVVNNILETLNAEKPLVSHKAENILPTVFIRNGYYQAGKLHLNVINKVGASWMQFDGNYKRTEQSAEENLTTILPLNGDWEQEVIVDTGFLFDIGLSVIAENSYQHDVMYLADGPWGVDMNDAVDAVDNFTINAHEQKDTRIGIHEVARGISASGQVIETINVFRNILGGERQLPTEDFSYLEFNIQNSRTIEVSLVTDKTADWNDRLRLSLEPNEVETIHSLSFADFKDGSGSSVPFSKLKSIVFSVQGDYKTYKPFNLKINQMTLSADAYTAPIEEVATIAEAVPQPDFVMNYPNPVEQYTVITFPLATDRVEVSITAMTGRLVYKNEKVTAANQHSVGLQLGGMAPGLYAYVVRDMKNNKVYRGKLIKK